MDYKVIAGVCLIAVGGYLLWKQNQDQDKKEMIGIDGFTTKVVGNRSKRGFVSSLPAQPSPFGLMGDKKSFVANNMNIQSSNWM
jgi:hypothetical protein